MSDEITGRRGRPTSHLTQVIREYEKASAKAKKLSARVDALNGKLLELQDELDEAEAVAAKAKQALEYIINA